MENSNEDNIGERFAALTGILEDAATMAVEGQQGSATEFRGALVVQIDQHLGEAHALLADIRSALKPPK